VAVGSGQALKIGEEGNADVICFIRQPLKKNSWRMTFGIDRRLVMHNDFVIVGPSSDPAGIRGKSPVEALDEIYASRATFVSRGDESGTHVKELALWKNAELDPAGEEWYLETGQGQGATLSIASEKKRLCHHRPRHVPGLQVKCGSGDSGCGRPIFVECLSCHHGQPRKVAKCKSRGCEGFRGFCHFAEGQKIIGEFGMDKYGQQLFVPDADKTDADLGLP
jgi:tungstate transport system substrate-binding protein